MAMAVDKRKRDDVIERWQAAIGPEHVIVEPDRLAELTGSVAGIERDVPALIRPGSTEEVQQIVRIAAECRQPIYPISTGKNWGMGSRLPATDGTTIVDLSRMDRIRDLDARFGTVEIEPGVTQLALAEHLAANDVPFFLNAVGSSSHSSVLGNGLDRGVGFYGSRAEELHSLEVVLGTGEILRTGFGHDEASKVASLYSHGIGPSLDGLFFQSNFGVVTAATYQLVPRAEELAILSCRMNDPNDVGPAIDTLRWLWNQGVINSSMHIASPSRGEVSFAPAVCEWLMKNKGLSHDAARREAIDIYRREIGSAWSIWGGISGTRAHVKQAKRCIRRALRRFGPVRFLSEQRLDRTIRLLRLLEAIPTFGRKYAVLSAWAPAFRLPLGWPTDKAVNSVYWPLGRLPADHELDPTRHDCGYVCVLPILPLDRDSFADFWRITSEVFEEFTFEPYVTVNVLRGRVLEGVVNLAFDKRSREETERADRCIRVAHRRYARAGFTPYRTGVQFFDEVVSPDDAYWSTVAELKSVFDPQKIIAPKRYNLV